MDLKDCMDFAGDNPVSYIGTADGEQPRVRAFRMWFADESGSLFSYRGLQRRLRKEEVPRTRF